MQSPKIHALISFVISFASLSAAQSYADYPLYDASLGYEMGYNASFPDAGVLRELGEISGVHAVNSSHIYVFHRADRQWNEDDFDESNVYTKQDLGPIKKPTIVLLVEGKIVRRFGEGIFFLPHSITVDHEGNIWVTDVALHQAMKFTQRDFSKPAMVLGERFKPGKDDKHFCKPTDVKVASNGEFFVADGYCNNRVIKFKADGSLTTYWGEEDGLNLPHGLALVEELETLLVADRENNRIVAYSSCKGSDTGCGKLMGEWNSGSPVYAVDFDPITKQIYALVSLIEGSFVQVFDFESPEVLEEISGAEHENFGMGHALSALKTETGFVVGSLIPDCPPGIPCFMTAVLRKDRLNGGLFLYKKA